MTSYSYLSQSLLAGGSLRDDLAGHARAVARLFTNAGIDPTLVELLAEMLARLATELGNAKVDALDLTAATAFIEPPGPVIELLQTAATTPLGRPPLAALAIHLVDIAEEMAMEMYIAELPALTAKSDRTGEAARSVGVARHLRG